MDSVSNEMKIIVNSLEEIIDAIRTMNNTIVDLEKRVKIIENKNKDDDFINIDKNECEICESNDNNDFVDLGENAK
jgi:hypothetical protein